MPRAKKNGSRLEGSDPLLRQAYEAADRAIAAEKAEEEVPDIQDERVAPSGDSAAEGVGEEDDTHSLDTLPNEGEVRAIESITGELVTGDEGENASLPLPMTAEVVSDAEDEEDRPLTDEERDDLIRLEGEVDKSLFRAALALKEIRDRRLYRATHTNFKDYCRERFDFGSSYSFSLVNAATIFENIEKSPRRADFSLLPENPYQLRPLEKLRDDPERQAEAWGLAVERSEGKQPTFRAMKEAVEEVTGAQTTLEKERIASLAEVEFSVIRGASLPTLSDRKGYWGRIDEIDADGNVTVTLYDRTVENVPFTDLSPMRGTKKEVRQREKLLQRLQTIHEGTSEADRAVRLLMRHFGTLKDASLTPVEEDMLRVLERRARATMGSGESSSRAAEGANDGENAGTATPES